MNRLQADHIILAVSISLSLATFLYGCSSDSSQERQETTQSDYAEDASGVSPVLTGTTIPDISLLTAEGEQTSTREIVSQKPTVLIFYRGGWCPYCNRHLAELQQAHHELTRIGYQVVAVSPDQPEYLRKSMNEKDLGYTLLSDSPMKVSRAFGLAFKVDSGTVQRYKRNGMDLAERSGYDHHLLPVPAVYLVNPDGLITFQYVNPDYKTRIKPSVLIAAAEAYYPSGE